MQNSRRISIIARVVYPYATGGAEIHIYYVAKELAKHNKVTIISERKDNPLAEFQGCFSSLNARIPSIPFFSSLFFILYALFLLFLKARQTEVVHAQIALAPVVIGLLAKMVLNVPFIVTCHGSDVRMQKNLFVKMIQRIAFAVADRITAVSYEIKSILISRYHVDPNKIDVIPNGYDEALLNNFSKTSTACNIVYVGRLAYPKDPLTLLRAFEKIHKDLPYVNLRFVGDGQLRPLLKEFCDEHRLSNNVQFSGKLPHHKAVEITAKSTVFVLSSYEEGLPTSLIEAMALGKPIIATTVGGIPEIVANGVNGLLVPSHSPILMADACMKLLTDEVLRKTLGINAAQTLKDFTWNKIAEKYETTYNKVLSQKNHH